MWLNRRPRQNTFYDPKQVVRDQLGFYYRNAIKTNEAYMLLNYDVVEFMG